MNAEVKKLWIDALRSGEYEQGKGQLRSKDNKFCCLGVLCDLYQKHTGEKTWVEAKNNDGNFIGYKATNKIPTGMFDKGNMGLLPSDITKWAGLLYYDGRFLDESEGYTFLDKLNDAGATFTEIADAIEKYH